MTTLPFWTPPCPFKLLTGLDCPGCGGTRMVWSLLHGDIPAALHYNALALVLLPVVLVWLVGRVRGVRVLPQWRHTPIALLCVAVLWTVVRNLPVPPFDALYV